MTVHSIDTWATNAELIADVAELGWLDGRVLDVTYGYGNFWTEFKPETLMGFDLNPRKSDPAYGSIDFRKIPFPARTWDVVVFDPPYKLSGTPALGDFDEKYGIDTKMPWQDRVQLIRDGFAECCRVAGRTVLAKVQDQVVSGAMRWVTKDLMDDGEELGFRLADRFDFGALKDDDEEVLPRRSRPQPGGRRQVHARHNASQLLVFTRTGRQS